MALARSPEGPGPGPARADRRRDRGIVRL